MKARREWVWCLRTKKCLDAYFGERTGNKVLGRFGRITLPSAVRCPDCGKKFGTQVRECSDANCWHVYIPAHKKWVKP